MADGGEWNGKITNLNISAEAFPELYRELSPLRRKARGDRLRALALLGLYTLRSSAGQAEADAPGAGKGEEGQTKARKNALREKLLDTL